MNDKTTDTVIRIQGLLELSVLLFLLGILVNVPALVIIGGILMIIDDLLGMFTGALNPLFPIVFAIILAFIIKPWYLGVFWSTAIFSVIGLPTAFRKIFKGSKALTPKLKQ